MSDYRINRRAALWAPVASLLGANVADAAKGDARLPSDELLQNPAVASHRFGEFRYDFKERQKEATEKLKRLRAAMAERNLDGVLITTERNLNWLTAGGRDPIVHAQRESPVKLFITADKQYLVADNIEGPRLMSEEINGLDYEWMRYDWFETEAKALAPLLQGKQVAVDTAAGAAALGRSGEKDVFDFAQVYFPLTQGEVRKYRWLGEKSAQILEQLAQVVQPGMTEWDLQYLMAREFWYWDIFPTVNLAAVDERFILYRHPMPVGATLRKYAALNVCARRWGLVVSLTRMVHFGQPDEKLAKAWADGTKVAAAMWDATRPGNTLGEVVEAARRAYRAVGFPKEWELHHQGGPIAALERLWLVKPGDRTPITPGMALAWNPTLQGAKFEDTAMVKADGSLDVLTPCTKWPTTKVDLNGRTYKIPGLLIR